MSYVELKCRTNFSFLEGASHPEEFVRRAAELGLSALGVVDRNGVYGIPKAYQAKKSFSNLKLIVGAEVTLESGPGITFLARNRAAYGVLCRILTESHLGQEKGQARIDWARLSSYLGRSEAQGLVAIAESHLVELRDHMDERLFYPLRQFLDGRDEERLRQAQKILCELGIKSVATNEPHYHDKARARLQDVVTAVRVGRPLKDCGFDLFSNSERYLKSPKQMQNLFRKAPGALALTEEIAESCRFSMSELRYRYPSEWIPQGETAQSYLVKLTWQGARARYPNGIPSRVEKQLQHELNLIRELEFADYFLTIYEIVDFARQRRILCQGRGSAANSAVCYCLGITAIDPVRMNLLFERFISSERGEPPDIDVDFEHERREEVIQHIYEKYGRDRAAMVSAVVTYQRRSCLREVGKALGLEVGVLSAKQVEKNLETLAEKSGVREARQQIEDLSREMTGFPRHLSIHSGGFTLSADPIVEIVPVEPARMEGRTIIQWDKYDLDYLGLLKIDILALGMLSTLRKTLDQTGIEELYRIPAEDPDTYAMIQKGDTVGTFQIESRAQMSMLGRLKPKTFYDLVVEVAIVRPGPIVGKMVHPYLRRRQGKEPVDLQDPRMRAILGKTLGVPLFQEQVMKLAIELAGFTPGEADELRRAIGAWRSSGSLEKMGQRLMEGLERGGLSKAFARQVFDQIQGFSQYGFPESHAASFALLAYASAYLKCHYPAEFLCALINSQPMGFYSVHTLVDDAKRHGVEVLPVSPGRSLWDCQMEGAAVRLGWRVVVGLSRTDAENLISERARRPFANFRDFLVRTKGTGARALLRRDVLMRLAMGGGFREFGVEPREALWEILGLHIPDPRGAQMEFWPEGGLDGDREGVQLDPLTPWESMNEDYRAFHLSTQGHPMKILRRQLLRSPMTAKEIKQRPAGARVCVAGLVIIRQRPPTAKGMMFCTLEDETGFSDLVVRPDVREKFKSVFDDFSVLKIHGQVQRDGYTVSLLVQRAEPLLAESSG